MRRRLKKLIGITTAAAMAVSLVPTTVFAEEPVVQTTRWSFRVFVEKIHMMQLQQESMQQRKRIRSTERRPCSRS